MVESFIMGAAIMYAVYWAMVALQMYIDNRAPRAKEKAKAKAKSAPESRLEHRALTMICIALLTFYVAVAGISHLIAIGA